MSYWVCAFRRRIEFVNLVDFSSLWTWLLHLPLQIECYIANDSLSSWHLDDLWCLRYLDALSSSWDSNDASQNVNRMLYGKGLITLTSAGWSPFFSKRWLQPAEVNFFSHPNFICSFSIFCGLDFRRLKSEFFDISQSSGWCPKNKKQKKEVWGEIPYVLWRDESGKRIKLLAVRPGGKGAGLIWIRFAFFQGARSYLSKGPWRFCDRTYPRQVLPNSWCPSKMWRFEVKSTTISRLECAPLNPSRVYRAQQDWRDRN